MKSIIQSQGAKALPTLEATLEAAGLNWKVLTDDVAGVGSGIVMPRTKLLYRSDTRRALGVVGIDYEPSDPHTFLSRQFEMAAAMGGSVAQAGFCEVKSKAFCFVRLGEEWKLPKSSLKKGDPVQTYLYSTDGWDGGTPSRSRLYVERLRCLNGMTSTEVHSHYWVSHGKGKETRELPRWEEFQEGVTVQIKGIQAQFIALADATMTEFEMLAFLENLLPGESTRTENRRAALFKLFSKEETGNLGQTRWDAYNAVTEYVTHERGHKEMGATSSAEENRFYSVLEKDTLRAQAMKLLLN
jgi:hypothetical protein